MRAKSFMRIILTVSSNPLKYQEFMTKVPELSTNILTSLNTSIEPEYKSDNNYHGNDHGRDNFNDSGSDDEDDLKAITAIFGFCYIGHLCYKGIAVEKRVKRTPAALQINLKQPKLNLKYYNKNK